MKRKTEEFTFVIPEDSILIGKKVGYIQTMEGIRITKIFNGGCEGYVERPGSLLKYRLKPGDRIAIEGEVEQFLKRYFPKHLK